MPKLCVIPGDGIGKEVIPAAVSVLQTAVPDLTTVHAAAGWQTFLDTGTAVPAETVAAIRECRAALFGAVSSPSHKVEGYRSAILTMRQALDLYVNVRPVRSRPGVSPRNDVDLIVMRENSEGLYSGRERIVNGNQYSVSGERYSVDSGRIAVAERIVSARASRRIAEKTLALMQRLGRQRLTIVHKANVLPLTDGLFRDTVREVFNAEAQKRGGTKIQIDELLVDVAALKMVAEPQRFDVIVTTNLFGDILSDAAAHWGGGLGLAPSLNWGDDVALAEPVHGSAPDIAGQGLANPLAAILSGALLARFVWGLDAASERIETAVTAVLAAGIDTKTAPVTKRITEAVLAKMESS